MITGRFAPVCVRIGSGCTRFVCLIALVGTGMKRPSVHQCVYQDNF